jgi:Major Facilitator Superfamily
MFLESEVLTRELQIHSLVAIAELGAPPVGGLLFAKLGREGLLAASMVVLAVDLVMRLLLIEKKVASAYLASHEQVSKDSQEETDGPQSERAYNSDQTENEALLPQKKADNTRSNQPTRVLPIVYCLTTKRLLVALGLGFVQALIIGTYDATLAIEAAAQFGFSSLETGFLFLAIGLPSLLFAPLGGWAVDRYGIRVVATTGFAVYAPFLALLRLSSPVLSDRYQNIALFCLILAMNGVCLSVVGTAGIVEANNVVENFVRVDPSFFGPNGAYGQLFGLTTFAFNAGLTVGPLCSGPLRESFGYGNMYAMVALMAASAAILSSAYLGERYED